MQIQNAHSRFELLLPFALCLALTFPPSTSLTPPSCTSYPGQFLPPVWGTSNIVGFGGQDVSLIITQSDLHPAPDSLPLAPDTSFACGGLERRGGGERMDRHSPRGAPAGGCFGSSRWPTQHRGPRTGSSCARCLSSARFLFFRLVPHFCPSWVSAAACHWVYVCVCIQRCVRAHVCVCVCVGMMMQQAVVQPWQQSASSEFSPRRGHTGILSIFNQQSQAGLNHLGKTYSA